MSEPAFVDADAVFTDEDDELAAELAAMTTDDILRRTRLIENELRVLKDDEQRLRQETAAVREKLKDNVDKVKLNKQLPYLVGNVVEVLDGTDNSDTLLYSLLVLLSFSLGVFVCVCE